MRVHLYINLLFMKWRNFLAFIVFTVAVFNCSYGQQAVSIPAYTAYAIPAEESNNDGESNLFKEKAGIQNWTDTKQQIQFNYSIRNSGKLNLSLLLKNDVASNKLTVSFAGKKFTCIVPQS